MFRHNLKYVFLSLLREKSLVFWLILFPVILGILFKIAFGSIYDTATSFSSVHIAVIQYTENEPFMEVLRSISVDEGSEEAADTDKLFTTRYYDGSDSAKVEEANKLLLDRDVSVIIHVRDEVTLSMHEDNDETTVQIKQSIVKSFVEQYKASEQIIMHTMQNDPTKLEATLKAISESIEVNESLKLTDGNTDNTTQYFYNLIAMVALLGSITGLHIAISSQGNLSPLGARRCCSPTHKFTTISAGLIGSAIIQTICVFIAISFFAFVLRVDFGNRLLLVYLASAIGGLLGVSFGFFIGLIGRISENVKIGISTAFTLSCCFFSGLMMGNIKALIQEHAPIVNKINPAALISDAFYSLNIYEDNSVYFEKLISMAIFSAILTVLGFVLTRRRKYASL